MKSNYLVRFSILSILLTAAFTICAFAQNPGLQNDLNRSFNRFELTQLNVSDLRGVENGGKLSIRTSNETFELNLYPRDLRSHSFIAEETSEFGIRGILRGPNTTFRGSVSGKEHSAARISIQQDKVEGFFESEGNTYYIEPASKYSNAAGRNDFIVYKSGDLTKYGALYCEDNLIGKIENGKKMASSQSMPGPQSLRVLELATEVDYELYQIFGNSSAAANSEILGLLNMIEGIYESELNLTISVVYQHSWATPTGYAGATRSVYLAGFKDFWNANRTNGYPIRDAAFLFSGKSNFSGLGQAFLATVCSSPLSAYAFTGFINSMEANRILIAHEIGHTVGANHAEAGQNCGNTIMNVNLSNITPFTFCAGSRAEINNHVAVNGSCLSVQAAAGVRFDFDGDRRADVGVFRPSSGVWFIYNSNGGFNIFQFGMAGDVPVSADYDGDGKSDGAVYRNGVWYRLKSQTNTFDAIGFGFADDIPAPADFDGDGKADIAVFRPSTGTWFSLQSGDGSYSAIQFGMTNDVPVPADYDGDGKADLNIFRPSNGVWYRINSSNGAFYAAQFGQNGDRPMNSDSDGDGKSDLAVWRPSNGGWYSLHSSNGTFSAIGFGLATDVPVAADFDGDGKTDISVFRPADGIWHRLSSGTNNSYSTIQFGAEFDLPIPRF